MKKIISSLLIGVSLFAFTSCGGSTPVPTPVDPATVNFTKYTTTDFSISYPKDWEVLTKDKFPSNVPATTVIVFRNNLKSDIFTANLNISQAAVKAQTTSEDFAIATINTSKYNLIEFKELSRQEVVIGKEKTLLVNFQGRKTITESMVNFQQTYAVRNGFGLIVTAAYLPTEDQNVVTKLGDMIKSFTLTN
jgi:hypothetical protein